MSELRQNPITKQWVLIAPKRSKRPEDFKNPVESAALPELDRECVFCPGNEKLNPDLSNDAGRVPDSEKWEIRVIQNKFQALEKTTTYRHREFYTSRSGYGEHEVIITRKHNQPLAFQPDELVQLTLQTFIDRIRALQKDPNLAYVQIFHNHGRDAGATAVHPHHQILATPIVPPHIHAEMRGCYDYWQTGKTCIYCDIVKEEIQVRDRLVYENEHFAVVSAYASRNAFETWIIPKKHKARFEDLEPEELRHLSAVLKMVLGQLHNKLGDPPLNFYIHTMPSSRDKHTLQEEKSYHWHMTIFPHISMWGGFEYATGIPINPVAPEVTAKFLRGDE
jgi:UDPglucose--hexose-1-phosphate uridylyltransferase